MKTERCARQESTERKPAAYDISHNVYSRVLGSKDAHSKEGKYRETGVSMIRVC